MCNALEFSVFYLMLLLSPSLVEQGIMGFFEVINFAKFQEKDSVAFI
jgi:hypothetical protein